MLLGAGLANDKPPRQAWTTGVETDAAPNWQIRDFSSDRAGYVDAGDPERS